MGGILETFGLKLGPFLSQVIIILIVYAVLKKYAFGPVTKMLEARRERIAEGEENLTKIKSDLEQAEQKVQAMLDEANKDAERLISEARESAGAIGEKEKQKAISEAQKIMQNAEEAAKLEHERLLGELKRDFGRLVIDTTSKVTGKVLDDKDQKRINEETAGQVAL
ncbi:MAG: F0F1 ATP synthase subunit B [Verrucomicrobiales bacterium]|nr:F0F1 ATP synthase subunit B [Verrucomicrobiales bacterium]